MEVDGNRSGCSSHPPLLCRKTLSPSPVLQWRRNGSMLETDCVLPPYEMPVWFWWFFQCFPLSEKYLWLSYKYLVWKESEASCRGGEENEASVVSTESCSAIVNMKNECGFPHVCLGQGWMLFQKAPVPRHEAGSQWMRLANQFSVIIRRCIALLMERLCGPVHMFASHWKPWTPTNQHLHFFRPYYWHSRFLFHFSTAVIKGFYKSAS